MLVVNEYHDTIQKLHNRTIIFLIPDPITVQKKNQKVVKIISGTFDIKFKEFRNKSDFWTLSKVGVN